MYKLIAIDLDGSLLDDDKNIPEENINFINEARSKGYEFVFATGRRYLSAKKFAEKLEEDIVIIANNGNMVRETGKDRLIYAEYLKNEHLEEIINIGKARQLHPVIHIDGFDRGIDMVGELENDHSLYYGYVKNEPRYRRLNDFLEEDLKILSIVYLGKYEELFNLERNINDALNQECITYLMENVFLADALLEVVNPVASKWNSIYNYARSKGIKKKEIIAIGDDSNDVEMIEKSGLGIGMKNSISDVLEVADKITERDNNQAGLSHELRKVLDL